jgi:Tfp pilus assembly PilM family ATPase
MSDKDIFSIIDYGSSNLRLGIFENYPPFNKFLLNENVRHEKINLNYKIIENQNINNLILNAEKETNRHLKNINVMFDHSKIFSLDICLKKKIEKINIQNGLINKFLIEARTLNKINLDGINYDEYVEEDKIYNEIILDIKFILAPKDAIEDLRKIFKNYHIMINQLYCSSYIKTHNYNKNIDNFKFKVFLDIGEFKTTLVVYDENKLNHLNNISIGSAHITSDISKILKYDFKKSENIKKSLKQSNSTFINNEQTKNVLLAIIHARVEEIIDLSFKNFNNLNYLKNYSSILIFTGDGSKILDKNSIYLKDEYKFFNDMTFFEENTDLICGAGYLFHTSEKSDEVLIVPKTYKKQGFFEKLFYYFSK